MDLNGKTVLVVGASGVLGGHLTRHLAQAGARVLATATSNQAAARIPDEAALRLLLNLEQPQSITTLSTYLASTEKLDGVVIASGRVGFGNAVATSAENASRLMQINFLGPAQLLAELHPNLAARDQSFVAAITGVVAERPFPGMAAYCASKQAFAGWLASVGAEWRSNGISITDARPGHTETGLAGRAMFGAAPAFPQGLDPEAVASKIMDGIRSSAKILASSEF